MEKLVSFDLKACMGMLKKPDINDGIYLTFNMLHKPALLGILGAVLGLEGYQEPGKIPAYYRQLKSMAVGIQPLNAEKGNFVKTVLTYNNAVGYANKGEKSSDGATLNITEQMIIRPAYRCYLLLEMENPDHQKLDAYLEKGEAEYLPYLGKNEFSAWWGKYQVYPVQPFDNQQAFVIRSIFNKGSETVRLKMSDPEDDALEQEIIELPFIQFEQLPVGFDEVLKQYQYANFAFTNSLWGQETSITGLYQLGSDNDVIQLF